MHCKCMIFNEQPCQESYDCADRVMVHVVEQRERHVFQYSRKERESR